MEQVLKRLYEIESAAEAIMQKADEKIQNETAQTIAHQKEELTKQIQKELEEQKKETERLLLALEQDYQKNHNKLAKQILQSLIQE